MKMRARNVAWLLPFFLTACFPFHKKKPDLDQLLAPVLANLNTPPLVHPDLPASALELPTLSLDTDADVEEEDLPALRHRRPPKPPAQQVTNPPAAPDESSGVSAIGTLSSGEASAVFQQTEDSIAATERGLNGLSQNLNDQERKTLAQIKEYLKQAKEALSSGDVDGAHTLATKAKAVLSELSR
jgi:hypothetical protein